MRSGDLRHRVTLERPVSAEDTNGATATNWETVAEFMAAIDTLSVREQFMAAQEHASATHRIRTRYQAGIAGADGTERIVFGDRIFPLVGRAMDVGTRHREVHFLAEEGLKDG